MLEDLYRIKSLPNWIYLKEKFFGYKMDESKLIEDNLNEFNKLFLDLETLDIKINEDEKVVVFLNSLPKIQISKKPWIMVESPYPWIISRMPLIQSY